MRWNYANRPLKNVVWPHACLLPGGGAVISQQSLFIAVLQIFYYNNVHIKVGLRLNNISSQE